MLFTLFQTFGSPSTILDYGVGIQTTIEIIKDQVPKVGEWEEEYLAHQPTTYPNFVDPFQVIQIAGDADIY